MPRQPTVPKLRRQKARSCGVVTLNGKDHYFGRWPADQADPPADVQAEYDRLIGLWLSHGRRLPPEASHQAEPGQGGEPAPAELPALAVTELCVRFMVWAEGYYRHPDGRPTGEDNLLRLACRVLRRLYGQADAAAFKASDLRALQAHLVRSGRLCRTSINARVSRVRQVFKWAVSHDLVPASVHQALATVPALKAGRTEAREPDPVTPVAREVVEATLPFLSPPVRAMVLVQLYTGCRAGELVVMRYGDLDATGPVWAYTPRSHKKRWRGKTRMIFLGPRAQEALLPLLPATCPGCGLCDRRSALGWRSGLCGPCADRADEAGVCGPWPTPPVPADWAERVVFRPREGLQAMRDAQKAGKPAGRRGRARKGKKAGKKSPKRRPGERYTTRTFNQAISRGCAKAGVEHWSSHRLRHAAGTLARQKYGLEAAKALLGHDKIETSLIYSEADMGRAAQIARDIG